MPNSIERDVYVLRDTLKNPISYVRGTDLLPIILHFRDFAIPSGATAKVFVAKNDGNAVYGGATITGNDVTVDVTQQMFITLGVNLMQVEIDSGNETLVTFEQPVMVAPNLKAGDLPDSTTDVDFIDKIIEQAQEAVNDANAALETANTAISGANTAAESANSAAQNANNVAEELQDKVDAGDFTASVQVGTTTTLEPDQDATVSNSGTNKDVVLNFGIPKGDPGTAASIQVGTTQTVQPEENAEVNNSGTTSAAVLNFKIPRGKDGMTDLTAEYTDASEYTCQPTVNAPVVVKELDGKTEQVETTGAQLINNFDTNEINASGYVVYNMNIPAGTYTISCEVESNNSNTSTSGILFIKNDGNTGARADFNRGERESHIITISDDITITKIGFYTGTNAENSNGFNATFKKVMLNSGSTALPYEPYTGGTPAPSPDYPQVIKGVGGMGYFDGEWVQGNISSTGTIGTETTGITSANAIPCKQNDSISVTYEDSIDVIAVAFYNASGAYISTSTSGNSVDTFATTAPANAASFKVNLRVASGSTIIPNGAKYCTVTINGKYASRVESNGKNLVDFDEHYGSYGLNGEYSGAIRNFSQIKIPIPEYLIGKKLIFSAYLKISVGLSNARVCVNSAGLLINGNYTNNTGNYEISKVAFTANKGDYISFNYSDGGSLTLNVKRPQLEIGETPTEYAPYRHTSIQFPLTNPLYDGDKVCYVKPGESYIDENGDTVVADRMLYGVYRENAVIKSYNSEEIPGEYKSSAGELTTGAEVVYKLAQPWFEPFEDQTPFYNLRSFDDLTYIYSDDPLNPTLTVDVAKNQTGGYLLESYAQAQKNAISEANSQSRLSAIEQQLVNQATTPTE